MSHSLLRTVRQSLGRPSEHLLMGPDQSDTCKSTCKRHQNNEIPRSGARDFVVSEGDLNFGVRFGLYSYQN